MRALFRERLESGCKSQVDVVLALLTSEDPEAIEAPAYVRVNLDGPEQGHTFFDAEICVYPIDGSKEAFAVAPQVFPSIQNDVRTLQAIIRDPTAARVKAIPYDCETAERAARRVYPGSKVPRRADSVAGGPADGNLAAPTQTGLWERSDCRRSSVFTPAD